MSSPHNAHTASGQATRARGRRRVIVGRGGLPEALVNEMYAAYLRLKSVAKVGKLFGGRTRQSVWEIFSSRKLPLVAKVFKTKVVHNGVPYTLHGGRGQGYLTTTSGDRSLLHHVIWTEAHGPIPPGHHVCFRDGDAMNCAPGNLVCLPLKEAKNFTDARARAPAGLPVEKAVPLDTIFTLHSEYSAGASMRKTATKIHRSARWLAGQFRRLDLEVRDNPRRRTARRSRREILGLADSLSSLRLPTALKSEWCQWPLSLRGRFIARARARLKSPHDRPTSTFSENVEPFDYASAHAHRIAAAAKGGHRLKFSSQGVIWDGQLWFWSSQARCYVLKGVPFRTVHHAIWEAANGRKVPDGHCVCYHEANPNNLHPDNLTLRTKAEILPEIAGRAVFKRSRLITAILLKRSQRRRGADQLDRLVARSGRDR